jgi:hypothetical protein
MSVTTTILDEIQSTFKDVTTPTYTIAPASVTLHDEDILNVGAEQFPNISILDTGEERLVVQGASDSNDRFEWMLEVRGAVKCDTEAEIPDELAKIEALIKKVIYNEPTLTAVLQWKFEEIVSRDQFRNKERWFGLVTARTRILYYVAAGAY